MTRTFRKSAFALLAAAIVCSPMDSSVAQDAAPPPPPVTVGGFAYKFIPRGRIHMNVCQNKRCGKGSKVSYTIHAPVKKPNFEQFKLDRKKVGAALKARAPAGVEFKFGKPERERNRLFTTFTHHRYMYLKDGRRVSTKTTNFYGKHITIMVISSANTDKRADANSAQFLVPLMIWSKSLQQ